jgi:hypothetical protein
VLKRMTFALALSLALGASTFVHARDGSLAGVVTRVEADRLEIRTDSQEKASVALTEKTAYLKWILAKPWQQDARADVRSLRVGRRVHIDTAEDGRRTAKTVWIVTGRPGFE